jgi:membrane protein
MADFKTTVKRIFKDSAEDDIPGTGARVAFFFALAIFPAIIALFAITGIAGGDEAFQWIMERVRQGMPEDAAAQFEGFVEEITGTERPGLLSVGLLGVVWAASNAFNGLTIGLNRMYGVEEERSWLKRRLLSVGMLIIAGIVLNLGTIAIIAGPELAEVVGLGAAVGYLSWILAFALLTALLWITYYILPNRDQSGWKREVLIGAVCGTAVWIVASALFRVYVSNFGNYSATYGFVGGIIVLLLWLYITAISILFGGEVASTLGRIHAEEPRAERAAGGRTAPA